MQMDAVLRRPTQVERLYIDFDSFFASVEQQLRPELRGRPVGVLPLDSPHTSIIAASYEAKKLGIKTGTPVKEAQEKCPDIALPVARHDEYVRQHQAIVEVIGRHLPITKIWSIDEMECELLGRERELCRDIAIAIRQDLIVSVGMFITPSIGIASNQFLAKIAAEMEKPQGLVILKPEELPGPLLNLNIGDLPGIADSMEKRLAQNGITTVEALWNLSPKHARAIWRSVEGERLWAQLRGYDVVRPETVRRMFGHGRVLSSDWRKPDKALSCARLLTVKAARRMRREGYAASRLNLRLSTIHDEHWQGEISLYPSFDDQTFLSGLGVLFREGTGKTGLARLKKISVTLHGLIYHNARMDDLLEPASIRKKRLKREQLMKAMDGLNARYNSCVLSIGPREEPPGGYAGAKIAFGRIPDLEDF